MADRTTSEDDSSSAIDVVSAAEASDAHCTNQGTNRTNAGEELSFSSTPKLGGGEGGGGDIANVVTGHLCNEGRLSTTEKWAREMEEVKRRLGDLEDKAIAHDATQASGADTHHAETKQQLDHAMQEIATDVKKVKEIVFGWSEQFAKVASCTV